MSKGQPTPATHSDRAPATSAPKLVVCRHCEQWENAPDDLYCSFCGTLLLGLEIEPPRQTLISVLAAAKDITFRNTGARALQVLIVEANGPKFTPVTIEPESFTVPANGTTRVRFTVDGEQLPAGFAEQHLEYACLVDNDTRKQRPLQIIVRSGPRPRLLTPLLDFGNVEEGESVTRTLEIANSGGTPLRVSSVEVEGTSLLRLERPFIETVLETAGRLSIAAVWQGRGESEPPRDTAGIGLRIRFANYPEPLVAPARAQMFRYLIDLTPAVLRFPRAVSTRQHSAVVKMENHGTTDVDVLAIEADQPWISVVSRTSTFTLLCAASEEQRRGAADPTTFARSFEFKVLCDPRNLGAGSHNGSITVSAQGHRPLILPVELDVIDPRPYMDYVGIDFGTTNSVVAVLNHRTRDVELVQEDAKRDQSYLIPSVLVFDDAETYRIGEGAKNEAGSAPDRTVRSIKRIMGYRHERRFFDRRFSARELASRIIAKLVELAEEKLLGDTGTHFKVGKAIITVPANFFDLQIREVLEACRLAGLDIEEERARRVAEKVRATKGRTVIAGVILDEPSAAVLYYLDYLNRNDNGSEIVQAIGRPGGLKLLVFDYGGGTLDVSIAHITRDGDDTSLRILANVGDNAIGGDSIDIIVMNELLKRCTAELQGVEFDSALISSNFRDIEVRRDREGWSVGTWREVLRVRGEWKDLAEKTKLGLSDKEQIDVAIEPNLIIRIDGGRVKYAPRRVRMAQKRGRLNDLLQPFLKKCSTLIESALDLAHIKAEEIDYVLHTGRQSLLPAIRQHVRGLFPQLKPAHDLLDQKHLKVCVAKGAALYGRMRDALGNRRSRIQFLDEGRSLPHSYGVETFPNGLDAEFDVIIPRGSKYPTEEIRNYGPDMIPDSGHLNLRFYQNTGTATKIAGNSQISLIGEISIDTLEDGKPGCNIRFAIGANRTLEVTADDRLVELRPAVLEEEEGWMG